MNAFISKITYQLPQNSLTTKDLADEFPEWSIEKIESKTGIVNRCVASEAEMASDLAVEAAEKLFDDENLRESFDTLLYCTQSPDYILPSTSCILQDRLGLSQSIAALDINLGCSGYIYGLGLAKAMILSGQSKKVLFITADTYSKYIHRCDRTVRTLFGDGAAATCIEASDRDHGLQYPFIYGTDGSGAGNLIIPASGLRGRDLNPNEEITDDGGSIRTKANLYMNGPEIFNFTLSVIPKTVEELVTKAKINISEIDLFVFHQANQYMLTHLRKRLGIPEEKFLINMHHCGNTVSSSIPIALSMAESEGKLVRGMKIMLLGFGVGYSWGGTIMIW